MKFLYKKLTVWGLMAALSTLAMLDAIVTYFLFEIGKGYETNPIMDWLMVKYSIETAMAIKIIATVIFFLVFVKLFFAEKNYPRKEYALAGKLALMCLIIWYVWAVFNNIFIIIGLRHRLPVLPVLLIILILLAVIMVLTIILSRKSGFFEKKVMGGQP